MIPSTVQHIYYRGFLKSCNYRCSYCPFAKYPVSYKELEKDRKALNRFIAWVGEQTNSLSIMFVPYGEALVHDYYMQALAQLSRMANVIAISCQTNLSLNTQRFIELLEEKEADLSKINLWATFHSEMVSKESFAEKIHHLNQYIGLCVGVVATSKMVKELNHLKSLLPESVYLWVNAMEGLNRQYTPEEINAINSIDPLFELELANPETDINQCCAGKESLFVTADGYTYTCNRNKIKLGNIYMSESLTKPQCKARSCDCFLAYVHRTDMRSLRVLGRGRFFRVSKGIDVNTLFFDIDGTLTNKDGVIEKSTIEAIKQLSKNHTIYLATALPVAYAMRKCKAIRPYLSGGVFANGADIRDFNSGYRHVVLIQPVEVKVGKGIKTLVFTHKSKLFKVAYTGKFEQTALLYRQLSERQGDKYHILFEDGIVSLTDKAATKLFGIKHLCKILNINHKNVMVVGNGENDIEILSYFNHSVAVQLSDGKVKNHAAYIMNIEQLPFFI